MKKVMIKQAPVQILHKIFLLLKSKQKIILMIDNNKLLFKTKNIYNQLEMYLPL